MRLTPQLSLMGALRYHRYFMSLCLGVAPSLEGHVTPGAASMDASVRSRMIARSRPVGNRLLSPERVLLPDYHLGQRIAV